MKHLKTKIGVAIFFFLSMIPFLLIAQDSESTFKTNCSGCHTIGGGRLVGPDLKGITEKRNKEWIKKFIKNSYALIESGDADAVAIAKEYNNMPMPPSTLSDAEIEGIYKYLEISSAETSSPKVAVDYLKDSKDENVINGYELFIGEKFFKNKGVSCIACHNTDQFGSGGRLAKNLTVSFNNIGAAGIKSMLVSPAFPAMINSYKSNVLTDEEIFNLTSYLRATANNTLPEEINKTATLKTNFFLYSSIGFMAFFIFFLLLYLSRKRGSVNDVIINRQLKTN